MAVKQFPQDYADITAQAQKIMAVKADGTMGFALVATLKAVLGLTLQDLIRSSSLVGQTATGTSGNPFYDILIRYGLPTTNSSIKGFNYYETNFGTGLAFFVNDEAAANMEKLILRLNPNGNANFTGNIIAAGSITPGSDKRLKKNIKSISVGTLELINQLRPVSYTLKSDNASALGFIADEVREIFPDLILEGDDEDEMLSMNYMGLTAPIVKAIQELHASHIELQNKYEDLLSRVEALEAK